MYSAEEIKTIIIPIAEKYGVLRIYLFGSYARGDKTVSEFHFKRGAIAICSRLKEYCTKEQQ